MQSTPTKPPFYLGIDLGGTKILAGVFDSQLKLIGTYKVSTKASRGPSGVLGRILRCIEDAIDECDLKMNQISAIGIGAPGSVNSGKGVVNFAPNLGWRGIPLAGNLSKKLNAPVFLGNDCSVSMLGVYHVELKSKPANALGLFIGTGIGGGLVIGGEPYRGFTGCAGEIGHMVIDRSGPLCGCGNRGCFEALASRNALFNSIRKAVEQGKKTQLHEILGRDLKDMRSGDLRKAIRRGDRLVNRLVREAAEAIGLAVSNLANVLGPEVVILGGGVIEALEHEMLPTIIRTARKHAMPGALTGVEIKASVLGDHAGITGAAYLARAELQAHRSKAHNTLHSSGNA
ncbi:MAG: ROK family protein [Verrucomicrobia bacterium]|nr:ROK family protein [Verrucomicrobiota bacterium]